MQEATLVQNVLKYQPVLEGMLTAMVGDVNTAQDLFQEVALVMTRKREEAMEDGPFLAWGRRIALNVVRDFRKKMARRKVRLLGDGAIEQMALAFEETDASVWDDRRLALEGCLDALPERNRDLLRRRYVEAVPTETLATDLSTNRNALDALLFRIRKTLLHCVNSRLQSEGAVS